MEICQRCSIKIEDEEVGQIHFEVWDVVSREWLLCPECTQVMRDVVFGFMGEKDDRTGYTVDELIDVLITEGAKWGLHINPMEA